MGHPVQFTPWGMVNHLGPVEGPPTITELAENEPAQPAAIRPAASAVPAVNSAVAKSTVGVLTPRTVVKMAKARVKEIRAELKKMRELEKELAALDRLLTAAKRPIAAVRNIESRRTTA